jgi:hypothetical protein
VRRPQLQAGGVVVTPAGAIVDQRGSVLILGLVAVLVAALLGLALFELGVIEANLVTRDIGEVQAFYCAEAQAARLYNLYDRSSDPTGTRPSTDPFTLTLPDTGHVVTAAAVVDAGTQTVTVTATCTLPDGRNRTVQRRGKREYVSDALTQFAAGGFGHPWPQGPQAALADLNLGGVGDPAYVGGVMAGGRDVVNGDLYVAGRLMLRGESTITGFSPSDAQGTVTLHPDGTIVDQSSGFDASATGAVGTDVQARPDLTNPDGTGSVDRIKAAVTNPDGSQRMKGTWGNSTVYNLAEIFRQLGEVNEGNSERNLARPSGCTFGVASADPRCQVWQDLAVIGPRRTCATGCPAGVVGPSDSPSYYFMGLPRNASVSPQQTSPALIFNAVVAASAELQQYGFVSGNYASLGNRIDALLGLSPTGGSRAGRLVDLTVGVDPLTGDSVVRQGPPIFLIDGYWRVDGGNSFVYNGRGTIVATKSMIISDNILYLGSTSNVNLTLPPSTGVCAAPASDRTNCGLADLVAMIAQQDIWFGDPGASGSTLHQVQGLMLAGRDTNMFNYTSAGTCCDGTSNPVTIDGTLAATREFAMMRDWAYPADDRHGRNQRCDVAGAGCKPVALFRFDPANPGRPHPYCADRGWTECWLFMKLDDSGVLVPNEALRHKAFLGGCEPPAVNPDDPCLENTQRRITHFRLTLNYDARARNPALVPAGLPTGGSVVFDGLRGTGVRWKDCGSNNPSCS